MTKSLLDHSTRAEIDLDALSFNLNQIRRLVGKEKKILAVVKANAYGHGIVCIARKLESLGVDSFGVAFLEEGIQLRKAGIHSPIILLGGIFPSQIGSVFDFDLTPVVYDLKLAHFIEEEGKRQNKKLPVHIKIDTGMNRLGVPYDEVKDFFVNLRNFDHIKTVGLLSHFSSANLRDSNSRYFTKEQGERFKRTIKIVQNLGFDIPLFHMTNSAAIIERIMPELNMVRVGLMLYGASPSSDLEVGIPLKPVMTLKTSIIQIKTLPPGSFISYGRTFCTKRTSRIATLAIGYGDGYNYRLSNRGKVLIRGKEASIVGSVCMDLTMADITDIPEAKVGDEVVLFGCQKDKTVSLGTVAQWVDLIPYEIICGISSRVPRIYKTKTE